MWDKETTQVSKRGLGFDPPTALGFIDEDSVGYASRSSRGLQTVNLQTGKSGRADCGRLAPGRTWEWAAKETLTFRRCAAGAVETRDLPSAIEAAGIHAKETGIYDAALNTDGSRVAFTDKQKRLTILDTQTRLARTIATEALIASLPGPSEVPRVTFSPDGHRIVLDFAARRFGVFDADALLHTGGVAGAPSLTVAASDGFRFSADSRWLVFEMGGGALELWDTQDADSRGAIEGRCGPLEIRVPPSR